MQSGAKEFGKYTKTANTNAQTDIKYDWEEHDIFLKILDIEEEVISPKNKRSVAYNVYLNKYVNNEVPKNAIFLNTIKVNIRNNRNKKVNKTVSYNTIKEHNNTEIIVYLNQDDFNKVKNCKQTMATVIKFKNLRSLNIISTDGKDVLHVFNIFIYKDNDTNNKTYKEITDSHDHEFYCVYANTSDLYDVLNNLHYNYSEKI